jgi:Ca2+-binding EF-hand superfamily protein
MNSLRSVLSTRSASMILKTQTKKNLELTEEQRREVREIFEIFDSDRNGFLEYYELKSALRSLGFEAKKMEVKEIVVEFDKTGNGVEFPEFLQLSIPIYFHPNRQW